MTPIQFECNAHVTHPEGLQYYADVITHADEDTLLTQFADLQLDEVKKGGRLAKRKMKCFGWNYDSTRKTVSKAPAMPDYLIRVLAISCERCGRDSEPFEQAIVTWYPAGYGIGRHPDAETFGDPVLGLSLATVATMKFYRGHESFDQFLGPRSLLVMSGPSRFEWEHEIVGRTVKVPRWSITFRSVLESAKSHVACDSTKPMV